jgi:hypothetical protein
MLSGEQHIQEEPERIHVGGDGDLQALHLLGGRELRSEPVAGTLAQVRYQYGLTCVVQQLREPEIQELHAPVGADQDDRASATEI